MRERIRASKGVIMRRLSTLLALCLLTLLPAAAAAASAKVTEEVMTSQGTPLRYALYVPAQLPAGAKVPLVVAFHRSRSSGEAMAGKWRKAADEGGFVVAAPDGKDRALWDLKVDGPEFLRDLVQVLAARLPLDPRRIYLFGDQEGGTHAEMLGLVQSEYVAAVASHAGILPPGTYQWIDAARRKLPIFVMAGNQDVEIPLESVRTMEGRMKAKGIPVEIEVLRGHENWYEDRAVSLNVKSWEHLRGHTLPGDPVYRDVALTIRAAAPPDAPQNPPVPSPPL
jgi:poly(3-hydroxybutyrate) depolymerase